jgi:hypothetical protein
VEQETLKSKNTQLAAVKLPVEMPDDINLLLKTDGTKFTKFMVVVGI